MKVIGVKSYAKVLSNEIKKRKKWHSVLSVISWVSRFLKCYAEGCYAECCYADGCYAECRYTECLCAECHVVAPFKVLLQILFAVH